MAACGPACIPGSQARAESELGQLTSSEGLAEAPGRVGISSSLEVGKEFALNHTLNSSVFSDGDESARSGGLAPGEDRRPPLS